MNKQKLFDAWAPANAIWSAWAKPVLFSQWNPVVSPISPGETAETPAEYDLRWAADKNHSTALVVDLSGSDSIRVAMSLLALGYRPVPLYNACPSPFHMAVVDVGPIMIALAGAVSSLENATTPPDAAPAFLLDAARNPANANRLPGTFDNRSISLPTDFPSANLLLSRNIKNVILIQALGTEPQADLSHTLRRWQEAGITILAKSLDDASLPQPISIRRPSAFRLIWYNLLATIGLKSSPLGGFGGHLPMPSAG